MNLGFVDRATVLHEFGHSLGLIHEHQSPFKGGFEWNREEVSNYVCIQSLRENMPFQSLDNVLTIFSGISPSWT